MLRCFSLILSQETVTVDTHIGGMTRGWYEALSTNAAAQVRLSALFLPEGTRVMVTWSLHSSTTQ